MPNGLPDTSQELAVEGQGIVLDFERTSDTEGVLVWTIPDAPKTYDGILIVGAIKEINPSNYPTDSVKYTASNDFQNPADRIGNAQVVVAIYRDRSSNTALVTGLDPEQVYFFSAHLVTSVRTYWNQGVRSYPQQVASTAFAGDMPSSYAPPLNPAVGQHYYDEEQNLIFVWTGTAWEATTTQTVLTGVTDPAYPFTGLPEGYPDIGDFFFNSRLRMLKIWNGSNWANAESSTGEPMYNKPGVGTDQTYTARGNLIDILKKQLGYPVVCVELIEDHFNIAIDNALQEIRRRTDVAYARQFFMMNIHRNQDIYYLNDRAAGTDKIVDVLKVHRLNVLGIQNFAPDNIYAQQFLQQFYSPSVGADLVSIHLIGAMQEIYNTVFSGEVSFNWREASREMRIYKSIRIEERVLLETSCEKLEQEILQDRWMQQWVQAWAESELMMILGHIRGKYASLPGPGGGLQLNADSLISQAQAIQEDCLRQIRDMEVGQNGPDNWYMPFAIG